MPDVTLSAPDPSDLRQYRDVSRLAIFALLLGLLSPLALMHPMLSAVPLAGVVVASAALVTLARRSEELTGRQMALWGLALALFFGSWSMGQTSLRSWILQSQARSLADHWLTLWQQGEFAAAHQLIMTPGDREPAGADLREIYRTLPVFREGLESFLGIPPRSYLGEMHKHGGDFRYQGIDYHVQESQFVDLFGVLYALRWEEAEGAVQQRIRITVSRTTFEGSDQVDWYIKDISHPDALRE